MYCINPNDDEPIFLIDAQIGRDDENPTDRFVDGNDFARELLYMDGEGKKRIQIWINSEGGSVKEGMSICSAILQTKTRIDTLCVGIAYSIAGVIFLMGRKREAIDFSSLMFHNPYNPDGSEDKSLEVIRKALVTAIVGRTKKSEAEVESILDATTFYSAKEAADAGIVDEVIDCGESNKPRATATAEMRYEYGNTIKNKLLPINKPNKMKTVAKLLKLNEEASEGAIVSEIQNLLTRAQKADDDGDEMDKLKNKVKEAEDALAAFTKKVADKEIADKAQAEDAAKLAAKAKASIDVKAKIKERGVVMADAAVEKLINLAGDTAEGLADVIETIEAIPVTHKAPHFKTVDKAGVVGEIPLIPAGDVNKDGTVGAGSTSDAMAAINSFDYSKQWKNRKRVA